MGFFGFLSSFFVVVSSSSRLLLHTSCMLGLSYGFFFFLDRKEKKSEVSNVWGILGVPFFS